MWQPVPAGSWATACPASGACQTLRDLARDESLAHTHAFHVKQQRSGRQTSGEGAPNKKRRMQKRGAPRDGCSQAFFTPHGPHEDPRCPRPGVRGEEERGNANYVLVFAGDIWALTLKRAIGEGAAHTKKRSGYGGHGLHHDAVG